MIASMVVSAEWRRDKVFKIFQDPNVCRMLCKYSDLCDCGTAPKGRNEVENAAGYWIYWSVSLVRTDFGSHVHAAGIEESGFGCTGASSAWQHPSQKFFLVRRRSLVRTSCRKIASCEPWTCQKGEPKFVSAGGRLAWFARRM